MIWGVDHSTLQTKSSSFFIIRGNPVLTTGSSSLKPVLWKWHEQKFMCRNNILKLALFKKVRLIILKLQVRLITPPDAIFQHSCFILYFIFLWTYEVMNLVVFYALFYNDVTTYHFSRQLSSYPTPPPSPLGCPLGWVLLGTHLWHTLGYFFNTKNKKNNNSFYLNWWKRRSIPIILHTLAPRLGGSSISSHLIFWDASPP